MSARAFYEGCHCIVLTLMLAIGVVRAQQEPVPASEQPQAQSQEQPPTQPEAQPQQTQQPILQQQIQQQIQRELVDEQPPTATNPPLRVTDDVCVFDPDKGPEMVVMPSGRFRMGSDEKDSPDDEEPAHDVTIDYAFALGRCEVTYAEFQQFALSAPNELAQVSADGCFTLNDAGTEYSLNSDASWQNPQLKISNELASYPVTCISVPMAEAYINWLNRKAGLDAESEFAYRLPSEAELEYALRGGGADSSQWLNTEEQCQYANMGDQSLLTVYAEVNWADQLANCYDGFPTLAPVGRFVGNPYGLHDLYGNVWEWAADCWNENYNNAPTDGSAWVDSCTDNEQSPLRGGSWYIGSEYLRSARRVRVNTDFANYYVGFRLARTLP